MTGEKIIFYILSSAIVIFSIAAVVDRRILRAAIYLLFVLVCVAGLFYQMNYEFLAAIQLMLYAGGIVVLIIFSILLTSQINSKLDKPRRINLFLGIGIALCGITLSLYILLSYTFVPSGLPAIGTDMRTIGLQLMDISDAGYALPFETISILLLAVLVGTIYIARKSNI